jgi:hypothetical protein
MPLYVSLSPLCIAFCLYEVCKHSVELHTTWLVHQMTSEVGNTGDIYPST